MSQLANQPDKVIEEEQPGRFKPVFSWDKERVSLVEVDKIDLKESMNEKAKGVSIYDLIEKYGDPELIPGYGQNVTTSREDNKVDFDLTNVPEFGTEILNAQMKQAEDLYAQKAKEAEEAAKAAAEAQKAAEEAAKAREAAINEMLAKQKGEAK